MCLKCAILLFLVILFLKLLDVYSQGYTNTDNPFGDAHLHETFVWQKVRPICFYTVHVHVVT